MKSLICYYLLLSSLLVSISASFLLDMNQEMNPIYEEFQMPEIDFEMPPSVRRKATLSEQRDYSKHVDKFRQWMDDRLNRQNKVLTAKIASIFKRSFNNGNLPDSVIRRLNVRYKKSFKKINILKTVDTDINTVG